MDFGLSEKNITEIRIIFSNYPQVEQAILFGSRVKGTYKPGSDIDIALKGNELNLQTINRIDLEFDDLYLPYKFDLVIYHTIKNQELISHIDRRGYIIYEK